MASQVLSGASNPSYTNNTGQNVRVVINYMTGTPYTPGRLAPRDRFGNAFGQDVAPIPSTLTLTWAGVSAGSSSSEGSITIGRNLAFGQLYRDTASGGTQQVQIGELRPGQPGFDTNLTDQGRAIFQAVGVNNSVALAVVSNNAAGFVSGLPTELLLAPGQSFSAVCGVYNIVVIPEAG